MKIVKYTQFSLGQTGRFFPRLVTSISNEAQKIMHGKTDKEIYRASGKIKNHETFYQITKPFIHILIFLIFIFYILTDKPTDKIDYKLDALNMNNCNGVTDRQTK